jgi:hypothetical protein
MPSDFHKGWPLILLPYCSYIDTLLFVAKVITIFKKSKLLPEKLDVALFTNAEGIPNDMPSD